MTRVRVDGEYQIVIPAGARQKPGIKPGDTVITDTGDRRLQRFPELPILLRGDFIHLSTSDMVPVDAAIGYDGSTLDGEQIVSPEGTT